VVNADAATLSLVRRLGSSGPIKLLFQRQSATLRAAETVTFRNLLYLDKRGEQKAYDLRPLGAQGAVLLADGRRIISCDGLDAGGLTSDAALAEIGPDCVCLVDAARLAGKQELFTASRPASVEVNLKTGTATVVAAADVEVGFAGGAKLKLSAGRQEVKLTAPEVLGQDVQRALESVGTPALPKAAQPHGEQAGGAPRELWRLDAKPMTDVADIASADVDGDGRAEAFVCAGRDLICLDAEGKERWRFNCKWPVLCVCVADANGDKKPEVLCGGRDKSFHVLDANGRLLVEHEMTEPLVIGQGGTRDPFVRCLAAADVNGDGSVEIVVGCTNSNISAFRGSDLTRLWTRSGIYHGAARIALTDLDGDGKLEVLVSDHYGSVHIISHDGRQETRVYSELGDVFFDSGDLDGDGKQEVLNGSGTGAFVASAYPGKPLWSFNNYGYAARTVLARDLDGDGKAEAIVGLDSGYLFALGGDGKPKWQLEVGAAILSLVYTQVQADQPSVLVAGLRDGSLLVVGRKGEILMRAAQPSPITKVHIVPEDLGKARRLLVLDESNVVRLLGFPH
jgi:outer membrane protein assembly factor BamB